MRGPVDLFALCNTALATQYEETTVCISLGEQATAGEAWSGFIRISGGEFIEFEKGDFLAPKLLTAEDSWMASKQ